MGKMRFQGGGGGGTGSDDCSATREEVLKGYKAVTKDSDDEAAEGTLELTGTAADSQVLEGQSYYNTDPKGKRTGGMPNRGAVSQALSAGGSYTIPAGYHNGSGKVTANSLTGQTSGTAAAADILSGKTAWVNGNQQTGTMSERGTWNSSVGMNGSVTIPEGHHSGSGKVSGPIVTQRGAWTGSVGMNGAVTVPEGYHNGAGKVSGPIVTQRGAVTASLNCGGGYTIPEGYHNGSGRITANSLASQTGGATAGDGNVLSGLTYWRDGAKRTGTMPNYGSTPTAIDAIRINNGRFEVAVKAGYHGYSWAGNGYEYMSYAQVASAIGLSADKIKKGVQIMNIIGTFEGYVPTPTDLYLRGNNLAGWRAIGPYAASIKFGVGQIVFDPDAGYATTGITSGKTINLAGYSRLNILCDVTSIINHLDLIQGTSLDVPTLTYLVRILRVDRKLGYNITYSLDISSISINDYVSLGFGSGGNIYRIWLS